MRKVLTAFALMLLLATLTGCENTRQSGHIKPSSGAFGQDSPSNRPGVGRSSSAPSQEGLGRAALQRGDGSFINENALLNSQRTRTVVIPRDGNLVELSLLNASIPAAAQEVLGNTLGLAFVVGEGVTGDVTIQTTRPVPKQALFDLFQAALEANGVTLENENDVLRLVKGRTGNRSLRLASDGPGAGSSIIVAPLEYVSASEMMGLLQPLISEGLQVVPDEGRNILLMSGPAASVEAGLDALNLFDIDVLSGKSIALVPVRAAAPEEVVAELNKIFETGEGQALSGVVEFVPNQRLGSILVIANKARYLDRAQRWIRDLDRQAAGTSRYLQTYDLQYRNADEVAPILDQLLADTLSTRAQTAGGGDDEGPNPLSSATKVAADTSRNALIVRATRDEHAEIASMLRDLDTAARQVLLEATIAEVTLNDELNVGVRWFFENGDFRAGFSDLDTGDVGSNFPGFSAVFTGGSAAIALNALAAVTDVKVISSPTLMVVDNQEGVLQIGDQVPIARQTSSGTDDNSVVLTQIEYRDTGIILNVRPRIGADGAVSLQIEQEVSDVSATRTSGIDSPTFSTRKVSTHAVLMDGQTLTLGGLVTESDNRTQAEVPGLGRTPIFGTLFRSRDNRKDRTELLIMIRPRVIQNAAQAARVSSDWRNKLNAADGLLKTGLGPARHTISDGFQ